MADKMPKTGQSEVTKRRPATSAMSSTTQRPKNSSKPIGIPGKKSSMTTSATKIGTGTKASASSAKTAPIKKPSGPSARQFIQERLATGVARVSIDTDDSKLPDVMVKAARKSGSLNLSNRGLQVVPDRVWKLNDPDEEEQKQMKKGLSIDRIEEESWWDYVDLTKLILASNQITYISKDIQFLPALTILDLHDNAISSLPNEIGKLENLQKLNLNHNKLQELPIYFFDMRNLRSLTICHNELKSLDDDVSRLDMLENLDLSHNRLKELPPGVGYLSKVTKLNVSHNCLKSLPSEISFMRSIKLIDLSWNNLEDMTDSSQDLATLEQLYLQHNSLEKLPKLNNCHHLKEILVGYNNIKEIADEDIENMANQLKILDLRDNKLEVLPDEIITLQSLERLDVTNNNLSTLPAVLGTLPHLKSLQVDGNPMKSIRRDIIQRGTVGLLEFLRLRIDESELARLREKGNISPSGSPLGTSPPVPDKFAMKTSQMMNMSKKDISLLPDEAVENALEANVVGVDLSQNLLRGFPENLEKLMDKIFELNLSNNKISGQIPGKMFVNANQLQYLNLSNNRLDSLPEEISGLVRLREVCLSFNKFSAIPPCLFKCEKLETLIIEGNQVQEIDVCGLKELKLLAILDLSNNNINHVPPEMGRLTQIKTLQLEGNPFRVPRPQILVKGTQSIMSYLRDRIPADHPGEQ